MSRVFPKRFVISFILVVLVGGSEPRGHGQVSRSSSSSSRNPIFQFGGRLLNQVALERSQSGSLKSNILISPFSIRTALAIIYLGTNGKTSDEIQKALQLPADRKDLIDSLSKQINVASFPGTSKLKIGNGLFIDKRLSLNESLVSELKSKLGASVQSLDFKSDPRSSANAINSWISSITQGQIQDLVSSSSLSVSQFLLANALFYSGQWSKPFTLLSSKSPFQLSTGESIPVQMISLESNFGYSYIPELKSTAISIPFKDDRFQFIVLKPDETLNVNNVRPLLIDYPLEKLNLKLSDNVRTVALSLPKFTLKANYDTVDTIRKLGINSLFDPSKAELNLLTGTGRSAAGSNGSNNGRLFVSRMLHQTILEINELGATAAAGTVISGYPISATAKFDVNKPFLFILIDQLTGPLLMGEFSDPRQ